MMKNKNMVVSMLLDFAEFTFIGVIVFFIIYLFVGQLLIVSGDSMLPTFKDSEQIIAEEISIKYKDLQRGEVVIFTHPKDLTHLVIKRIIGLPGETIRVENGHVYINNKMLSEEYLPDSEVTEEGEEIQDGVDYKIADNAYILMGDNRDKSTDSRSWGALPMDLIKGRGLLVYYPLTSFRFIKNDYYALGK